MKVLILEDFFYRAKQFKDRFVSFGITDITHVISARECIEHISKTKYDVIFLDYDLSNMTPYNLTIDNTGVTVAQWIKDHPNNINKDTHIMIHSGNEYGAAEIKKHLPNAHIIPRAWKKEEFDQVTKVLDLKRKVRNTQGSETERHHL